MDSVTPGNEEPEDIACPGLFPSLVEEVAVVPTVVPTADVVMGTPLPSEKDVSCLKPLVAVGWTTDGSDCPAADLSLIHIFVAEPYLPDRIAVFQLQRIVQTLEGYRYPPLVRSSGFRLRREAVNGCPINLLPGDICQTATHRLFIRGMYAVSYTHLDVYKRQQHTTDGGGFLMRVR